MTRPIVEFDDENSSITISGILYSYAYFASMATSAIGTIFRIEGRPETGEIELFSPDSTELRQWADAMDEMNKAPDPDESTN